MTVHLVTFSDESMSRSRDMCVRSAITHGGIGPNEIHAFSPWEVKGHAGGLSELHQLYEENKSVFDAPRGCGYWAWKPALLYHYMFSLYGFMLNVNDGDVVVYADAGVEFINDVKIIIGRMDQDIFLFGNQWPHFAWCKRDIVDEVWPKNLTFSTAPELSTEQWFDEFDSDELQWRRFGKQVQASVIFFRVNDHTRAFVKEWLDWCLFEGGRLIDDSPSRTPNHPEFQENRHDQAILTTMAYRDGIKLHWWPAVYGPGRHPYPKNEFTDDYPPVFLHHRRRNHEWEQVA